MKMYRVDIINLNVNEIEVDKETDNFVYVNGKLKMKKTDYHVYCYDEVEANLVIRKEIERKFINK